MAAQGLLHFDAANAINGIVTQCQMQMYVAEWQHICRYPVLDEASSAQLAQSSKRGQAAGSTVRRRAADMT